MNYQRWVALAGWPLAVIVALAAWGPLGSQFCERRPRSLGAPPVPVVAEVNGDRITWEHLEFDMLLSQGQAGVLYEGPRGQAYLETLRRSAIDALVERLLLYQEAVRRGYSATDEEVADTLDEIVRRMPEGTEVARQVAAGRYAGVLRYRAREKAVGEKLLKDLYAGIQVTDAEVEAYYRERPEEFRRPESVVVRIIRTSDRARAEAALQAIRGGLSFEEAARRYHEDRQAAATGGERTSFVRGGIEPAVEQAVFGLQAGQVSTVVQQGPGFYVFKVEQRLDAANIPFEQARERIAARLQASKRSRLLSDLLVSLRDRAKIVRYWPPPATPAPAPSPALTPSR